MSRRVLLPAAAAVVLRPCQLHLSCKYAVEIMAPWHCQYMVCLCCAGGASCERTWPLHQRLLTLKSPGDSSASLGLHHTESAVAALTGRRHCQLLLWTMFDF